MIRLSSNGNYWLATWKNSTGGRQSKSLGPKAKISKAAARRMMMDLAREVVTSSTLRDGVKVPTLGAWKTKYFTLRTDLKENTVYLHRRAVTLLEDFVGADTRLDRITRGTAADFRAHLDNLKDETGKGRRLEPITVVGIVRQVKTFLQHAVDQDLLDFNPFDRQKTGNPEVSQEWAEISVADLDKILDACPNSSWRSLFALARLAGLRRGEALRLRWGDIDHSTGLLSIMPEGRQEGTKQRARMVPMQPALATLMLAAWADQEHDGTDGPAHRPGMNNIDRDARVIITRALGATYAKPFHTLRKCLESEWMSAHPIMDVCQWLGHAPAIAQKHYVRASKASIENITKPTPAQKQEATT